MIIIVIMFIIIIKINNIFGGCTGHNKRLAEPYVQNKNKKILQGYQNVDKIFRTSG